MPLKEYIGFLGAMLQRMPTLADVASTAAFLASDRTAAMTGTVANLIGSVSVD